MPKLFLLRAFEKDTLLADFATVADCQKEVSNYLKKVKEESFDKAENDFVIYYEPAELATIKDAAELIAGNKPVKIGDKDNILLIGVVYVPDGVNYPVQS